MMKNQHFSIEETHVRPLAEKYFIEIGKLNMDEPRDCSMLEAAKRFRDANAHHIQLQGLFRFFDANFANQLHFDYLSQIPQEAIEGVYCYMLTAGEICSEASIDIMDQIYLDMWGTSYIETGVSYLTEEHIRKEMKERFGEGVSLSPSFGPGYFGMPVEEMKFFFTVLDGAEIGVALTDSGVMVPQKSCVGFYLVYNRGDIQVDSSCKTCLGNAGGCRFCSIRREKQG